MWLESIPIKYNLTWGSQGTPLGVGFSLSWPLAVLRGLMCPMTYSLPFSLHSRLNLPFPVVRASFLKLPCPALPAQKG